MTPDFFSYVLYFLKYFTLHIKIKYMQQVKPLHHDLPTYKMQPYMSHSTRLGHSVLHDCVPPEIQWLMIQLYYVTITVWWASNWQSLKLNKFV